MRFIFNKCIKRSFSTNTISGNFNKNYLFDSFPTIWNINKSQNSYLYDQEGEKYLDFHGGFGSNPIGWNHSKLAEHFCSGLYHKHLLNKPANCDFYTKEYVDFINKFKDLVVPAEYPHLFLIDGGALSVENALKIAMDWKYQKNGDGNQDLAIAHFTKAFHGRSGYTMSLTNTEPHKVKYFTKFNWPRLLPSTKLEHISYENQKTYDDFAIDEIQKEFRNNSKNIAGLIIEPIQCEGGDRHFTPYFLQNLQKLCNEHDVLFIVDEVQTGFYTTGKPWCFQHYNIQPDLVSFGKKSQQCGVFGGKRLDEIENHCFNTSGRLGSTWGGNHLDMIRATKIIDIIKEDNLEQNATDRGQQWNNAMTLIKSDKISSIRNIGLIMSFDCQDTETRNSLLDIMKKNKLLALGAGDKTIRMRPNLAVSSEEIQLCVDKTIQSLKEI